jgi:hypothetical protein
MSLDYITAFVPYTGTFDAPAGGFWLLLRTILHLPVRASDCRMSDTIPHPITKYFELEATAKGLTKHTSVDQSELAKFSNFRGKQMP